MPACIQKMFWQNGDLWKDTQLLTTREASFAAKFLECAPEVWLEPALCKRPSETTCQPSCWNARMFLFCLLWWEGYLFKALFERSTPHVPAYNVKTNKHFIDDFISLASCSKALWRWSMACLSRCGPALHCAMKSGFVTWCWDITSKWVHILDTLNSVGL